MLNIVLVEPEIPQNCGNIARTCAATGSRLHLIRPLGFDISDRAVKRAGLDYWHLVEVVDYKNLDDFFAKHPEAAGDCWLTTTKAPRSYQEARFSPDCWIFFGKETAGLPMDFRERFRERCIRCLLYTSRGCVAQQHVPHHTAAAGCGQPQDTYAENVHILVDPHKSAGSGKDHGSDQFKNQEKLFQAAYPSF